MADGVIVLGDGTVLTSRDVEASELPLGVRGAMAGTAWIAAHPHATLREAVRACAERLPPGLDSDAQAAFIAGFFINAVTEEAEGG
jgi:hypothetical protein